MDWQIGKLKIANPIVLAPMAGISNPTYIKICAEMGCGYAITELISSEAIVRSNAKTFAMLKGLKQIKIPVAIQIFGANPKTMAEAAKILVAKFHHQGPIDINMGCPVPKIALRNEAGSALLKNPALIKKIVEAVVEAVNVPVTVKIRSGWDEASINAVEVAQICEAAGAQAITVHARTRAQGYSGKANWQIIKDVVEAVKIPVIGNGDVVTCYDAKRMLMETGCTAVMIGRALLGNPWLIKECLTFLKDETPPHPVGIEEKLSMMRYHFAKLVKLQGEKVAVLEMRTQFMHYLKGIPESKGIKEKLCLAKSKKEIMQILDTYEQDLNKNNVI